MTEVPYSRESQSARPASDPSTWPAAVQQLYKKSVVIPASEEHPTPRRVVTIAQVAELFERTTSSLRYWTREGKIAREMDLDKHKESWYRIDEVARVYIAERPGEIEEDEQPPPPFSTANRAENPAENETKTADENQNQTKNEMVTAEKVSEIVSENVGEARQEIVQGIGHLSETTRYIAEGLTAKDNSLARVVEVVQEQSRLLLSNTTLLQTQQAEIARLTREREDLHKAFDAERRQLQGELDAARQPKVQAQIETQSIPFWRKFFGLGGKQA